MRKKSAATRGKSKRARAVSKKQPRRTRHAPKPTQEQPPNLVGRSVQMVEIAKLQVGNRLRSPDPQLVDELDVSMGRVGLLEPIVVTEDLWVVGGGNRVAAAKKRGMKKILAVVVALSDTEAELAEIDENLVRKELSALERSKYTARKKELVELLDPRAKRGGAPGRAGGGKTKSLDSRGFVADTAAKTGRGRSTIAEDVRIGRLPKPVLSVLKGTPVEKKKGQLLRLVKVQDPAEQLAQAEVMVAAAKEPRPARTPRVQSAKAEPGRFDLDELIAQIRAEYDRANRPETLSDELCLETGRRLVALGAEYIGTLADGWEAEGVDPDLGVPMRERAKQIEALVEHDSLYALMVAPCRCRGDSDCTQCGGRGGFTGGVPLVVASKPARGDAGPPPQLDGAAQARLSSLPYPPPPPLPSRGTP